MNVDKKWLVEQLMYHVSDNKKMLFEKILNDRTRHITVVLENIFQPHNASAVLRSCDCFGIQDVHIIENGNKYETSVGVDMGASKWLTLHKYNKLENNTLVAIKNLKEKGYKVLATTPHTNDCLIDELDIEQPVALMFGTELTGLSEIAMKHADGFVKLPMYGFTESYNISVSAALALYELRKKLHQLNVNWHLSDEEKLDLTHEWLKKVIRSSDRVEKEIIDRLDNK